MGGSLFLEQQVPAERLRRSMAVREGTPCVVSRVPLVRRGEGPPEGSNEVVGSVVLLPGPHK